MQAIKNRSYIIRIVSLLQLLFFFSFALQAQTENACLSQHGIKNLDTWLNDLVKENKIHGVEVISGKHLDEFYNERIFSPLHMSDTYFFVPKEKQNRIAGAYRFNATGQATQLRKSGEDDGDNQHMFDAAGGLKTTATDFAKFCQMLLNGGSLNGNIILNPSTVKLMLQDHIGSLYPDFESGCGWGFGGEIVNNLKRNELSEEGTYRWGGFYGNQFFVDVHNNLAAIIMIQMFPNYDLGVQSKFEILVRQALIK